MFVDRRGSGAVKVDRHRAPGNGQHEDPLYLWLADLDVRPPACVHQAVAAFLASDSFGYVETDITAAVARWYAARDLALPGFVPVPVCSIIAGVHTAISVFSQPADPVMVFTPTYGPLVDAIHTAGRVPVHVPLQGGQPAIDRLDPSASMLLVCHPNNPDGSQFSLETQHQIAAFCRQHNITVVSDEAHADFTFGQAPVTPWAAIDPDALSLASPVKSFNLAAIPAASYALIENCCKREMFANAIRERHLSASAVSRVALNAAYQEAGDWFTRLKQSLSHNRALSAQLARQLPAEITWTTGTAGFFMWLHLAAGRSVKQTYERINHAGVVLSPGESFGAPGWFRMNLAAHPDMLTAAFTRLHQLF